MVMEIFRLYEPPYEEELFFPFYFGRALFEDLGYIF